MVLVLLRVVLASANDDRNAGSVPQFSMMVPIAHWLQLCQLGHSTPGQNCEPKFSSCVCVSEYVCVCVWWTCVRGVQH